MPSAKTLSAALLSSCERKEQFDYCPPADRATRKNQQPGAAPLRHLAASWAGGDGGAALAAAVRQAWERVVAGPAGIVFWFEELIRLTAARDRIELSGHDLYGHEPSGVARPGRPEPAVAV